MSNKTSDKNVVNIEDDVNKIKEIIKRCEDFNKNLGYESEIYDGDTPFPYKELEHILEERVQDKKRIQELEAYLYNANKIVEEYTDSIPKQKVKDLIKNETINISGFECIAVEDLKELLEEK